MIDLIIPYYNDPKGIMQTLNSIDLSIFNVTIIDDGSNNYLPPTLFGAQVFRYNDNRGPGCARQWGINHTLNPYIMFIDTGDTFISKEVQKQILDDIKNNLDVNVFSYRYYHYDTLSAETDNRLHGKVYKREFLEKYDIDFCAKSSYLNEDIGFNRTCRIIVNKLNQAFKYSNIPIIQQIKNPESLTQKENKIALYKYQTRALSIVSIHTIDICKKNNIDTIEEVYQIAIALYYWFIRTAAERPELLQYAWDGARIFYNHFKDQIKPNKLLIGNIYLKEMLQYKNQIIFPINILRFTYDIQNNENLPSYYLT